MRALISGMGIAGPTLAYWLGRQGWESTLVERAPHFRTGGYVIDFWGSGFDVAERMGLVPEIRRQGYAIQQLRLVNRNGRRAGGFDVDVLRKAARGRYVSLPRSALAWIIYDQVSRQAESIFGDCITGIQQTPDGVDVTFEKSSRRRFDVVIGADGLHSQVRELVFGEEKRFEKFLGYSVAAFETDGYQPRDEDIYVNFSVPGKSVGRFALRGSRTLFLFVFADERRGPVDPRDSRTHKEILRSEFGTAGWECPRILAAMDACDELYFDRVSQIRMPKWSEGRVALTGDAAFCPSLLAGQGSALAMVSAYVLAGELGQSPGRPDEAFRRYEQRLQRFILDKQIAAEKFGRFFAPQTRLGLFLRNQATRFFAVPFITKRLMTSTLIDRIELPDYFPTTRDA
jgi:2-polyprenyl-6-methoxyphenol hydroxylase-like FAD-dependent oxidoreductase